MNPPSPEGGPSHLAGRAELATYFLRGLNAATGTSAERLRLTVD
jgi:hypothetical protein